MRGELPISPDSCTPVTVAVPMKVTLEDVYGNLTLFNQRRLLVLGLGELAMNEPLSPDELVVVQQMVTILNAHMPENLRITSYNSGLTDEAAYRLNMKHRDLNPQT